MFVAMNRFKITPGFEEGFEKVWRERDSYLNEVPGFKAFNLLKGPETEDYVLYASHSVWESRAGPRQAPGPRRRCLQSRQPNLSFLRRKKP